ncbi:2-succinyl-6-hydroxy-2,4-cyclohexadiene-1-carboxylate synthase [Vibrio ponticus]|uniref:2-succinyl-6-hydroxy-2, 4-cyclohexadiene-1-carboxylate synthase n=1 Tax=Vibrio ponticus TaxID=265668 RepID=A0ABX3FET6_9VIBR|nr:alpha/beta fold hydrolase [Vibrio ponticus]OLQ91332.1 2-succinyl-6-hydroxy-2,4-cyclohexadiene-1-carboxylate synthase [Vibrio ponticus]
MNKFTIDGKQMAYLDIGQGPVLLFGHSYLWDSKMWAPQVAHLSQSYRCIVPDLWSHGESDSAPQTTRSLQDYAQQMLALLDHLDIQQCTMIGLSVGGMWGTELVTLAPARVNALVLMDTFVGLEPEVAHNKYFAMLSTIDSEQVVPPAIIDAVVPLFFANNAVQDNPQLVAEFAAHLAAIKGEQASEIARIGRMVFGRRDQIEQIEKFALPTLIAVGQEDKPRPVLESYLMVDCIDGSELVQIPQAGHISNLEQPQFVNEMLEGFLSRVHA